jgi:hypothetical protein
LLCHVIVEECVERRMNNLIYISALLDRSGRIGRIVRRLHHENRHVRARAVEVLDNVGNARVNRLLIGLLDTDHHTSSASAAHDRTEGLPGAVIERLSGCPNEWVRTCAAYCRAVEGQAMA